MPSTRPRALLSAGDSPSLIKAKFDHYIANGEDYNVTVNQKSGYLNMVMIDGYGDPNPIIKNNTEKFVITGIWNVAGADLDHVIFTCANDGTEVYRSTTQCGTETDPTSENATDSCPAAPAAVGEQWTGIFNFYVPPVCPDWYYNVLVTAKDSNDNTLWEVYSNFYIE